MKKTQLALAMLVATGFAVQPFAAEAATSHKKHHSSTMSSPASPSSTTTGANMKSGGSKSQGNASPGTNQDSNMPSNSTTGTKSK